MKLVCKISITDRQKARVILKCGMATLALCKTTNLQYCLILYHSKDKNGTKYKLNHIKIILTHFKDEGKVTFRFETPPHDLNVQAGPFALNNFLGVVTRTIQNNLTKKDIDYMNTVEMLMHSKPTPTKLYIQKNADYPSEGLSRRLIELHINYLQQNSLDDGILRLSKLQVLDVSNNCIKSLPTEINKLPNLSVLQLSRNRLGEGLISSKDWDWIGGQLPKTLTLLDLSENSLKFIPQRIIQLQALITLNLNFNCLTSLPSAIGCLPNLRALGARENLITILPGTAKKWRLKTLDLSYNRFTHFIFESKHQYFDCLQILPLREYAALQVLLCQLSYLPEVLPRSLIDFLDSVKYCVCGKPCFSMYQRHPSNLMVHNVAETVSNVDNGGPFLPMDCFFCSYHCLVNNRVGIRFF